MEFSFSSLLKDVEAGLTSLANITTAVGAIKSAGASKESTLAKVVHITEIAATAGEAIPIPQVQAVSALVSTIVEDVFGAPAAPAPVAAPAPA